MTEQDSTQTLPPEENPNVPHLDVEDLQAVAPAEAASDITEQVRVLKEMSTHARMDSGLLAHEANAKKAQGDRKDAEGLAHASRTKKEEYKALQFAIAIAEGKDPVAANEHAAQRMKEWEGSEKRRPAPKNQTERMRRMGELVTRGFLGNSLAKPEPARPATKSEQTPPPADTGTGNPEPQSASASQIVTPEQMKATLDAFNQTVAEAARRVAAGPQPAVQPESAAPNPEPARAADLSADSAATLAAFERAAGAATQPLTTPETRPISQPTAEQAPATTVPVQTGEQRRTKRTLLSRIKSIKKNQDNQTGPQLRENLSAILPEVNDERRAALAAEEAQDSRRSTARRRKLTRQERKAQREMSVPQEFQQTRSAEDIRKFGNLDPNFVGPYKHLN